MKSSQQLVVQSLYSRRQLQDRFGINDATIRNGIFRPQGHDSVWLFVTELKTADRTQYQDRLVGDDLYFEGQTQGRTDTLITESATRGLELLLFYRLRKDQFPGYAFRYEGPFVFESANGDHPTKFHLRRISHDNAVAELPELSAVTNTTDIRENVRRFVQSAILDSARIRSLIRQTTYWVFDEQERTFAPNKFVGYFNMTLPRYDAALAGDIAGVHFDGGRARAAVESVVGPYQPDESLRSLLSDWQRSLCGNQVLDGVDTSKWKFATLQPRKYWALACNPDRYDAQEALLQLDVITWNFDRGDPRPGDRAIIWKAKGSGTDRGVIGLTEVLTEPALIEEQPEELAFWRETAPGIERRCRLRKLAMPNLPLYESQFPDLLSELSVAKARGGTVFSLEPAQWEAISQLARGEQAELLETPVKGQGYRQNYEQRRAIELHAQQMAENYFVELEYKVKDVSAEQSYDLHCQKNGDILRVEVKGTTGIGETVLLTSNEVVHAARNVGSVALVIVSNIAIAFESGNWVTSGGEMKIHWPWNIDTDDLEATQFRYRVPTIAIE